MPLSWNEIKDRALKFSHEWADESSEDAEAKSFWDAFFTVFGVPRRRVATFEQPVKKSDGHGGFIDLLWKGILLVEHKSRGKDLDRAFQQAKDYFPGLKDRDLPRYILVSDFARFRLYDLEEGEQHEFTIKDFYKNVRLFGFVAGYVTTSYKEQDPVNIKAAERMGKLHDKLKAIGYEGHELEVYLVRLLFCLFADDTSIFERRQFQDLIEQRTAEDGQDLAQWLAHLFEVLNTPPEKRLKRLDEQLAAFRYVNGSLFAEHLRTADFDRDMREILIECCALDWSRISPAIFGALFQSVMIPALRRNLGAHYTTEKNILKVIGPLFLDELRAEFERVKGQPKKLLEFHERIAKLNFLDPACGCGNFLVIAYRELRLLELDILRVLHGKAKTLSLDVSQFNILCDVDQFFGIEIEEFPAQIAQTALWLMDHQMNMRVSEEFGNYFVRLPLKKSATIVHGNALQRDWREIVKPKELSYIFGNPPFGGKKEQDAAQKRDMERTFADVKGAGVLDFVAAWYRKAAEYMAENPAIKTGFVSTNSISQGEQVGVLWRDLLRRGVKIHFAHRTFQWSSEARGKAAVHCVIIGFALHDTADKRIFDYENLKGEPHEIRASNINPYLVDAPTALIERRSGPLSEKTPHMAYGSMPIDNGSLILSEQEKSLLLKTEPNARSYIREYVGGDEFLNGIKRYCLWLVDCEPNKLRSYKAIYERIEANRKFRLSSNRPQTKELAKNPALFGEIRQPSKQFLLIPKVSSENRDYIPVGFCSYKIIASGTTLIVPAATMFEFGFLQSAMHMAWTRSVGGRLESRYQYSAGIVYNNFPWPQAETPKQRQAIEEAAQAVLDARAKYPDSSLADLYDPLTMPPDLVKAHHKLDAAVDAAYSKKKFSGDSDRVAFLFELYQQILSPLESKKKLRRNAAH
ncbi:DNA methyltransferase [Methylocella tundrae]|uniref:site-specific DNA-methyltransferase (adenine-specific) n=1 Tax=Methylocella tundrae TaxID=227605 RepID=A0A8B6M8A5_METTU|nr:DNA methyltransferase [Methylocella tundrae]VTZ25070.1 DNA methyltransferase [Methylocella tundrae]VTZ50492.1 DNA methyltransferase [Methylocella tundrae]